MNLEYDDIICCSAKNKNKINGNLIGQLSPLHDEVKDTACLAFVCAENDFVTFAPYMSLKGSEITYSVWYSPKDKEWNSKDLKQWYRGSQNEAPTFGNFKKVPFQLRVPHKLSTLFSENYILPVTNFIENWQGKLSRNEMKEVMVGKLEILKDKLYVKFPILNEYFLISEKALKKQCTWPVHILRNRFFFAGAPATLSSQKSTIPEVHELITELDKYKGSSSQALQVKAWMVWALERSLEMYTAQRNGVAEPNGNFLVHEVDYSKVYQPAVNPKGRFDCSKGGGLPMLKGNPHYEEISRSLGLSGFSMSPMVIANTLQYNKFVYGRSLGTPLGVGDALFFYDYGGDRTMPVLGNWIEGLGERLSLIHSAGEDVGKLLIEINVMTYEYIRAKKRYEDSMRRGSMKVRHICTWKDVRELLHFRAIDAAFAKAAMTSSLDEESYLAVGFAGLAHDVIDYGYDLSVCECSNTLYSFGAVDGSLASLEKVYGLTLAGLKYLVKVHRYGAAGLVSASTVFWQLCNGRHRILNCAMSVAQHAFPPVLDVKETLLETITGRSDDEFRRGPEFDHELCQGIYSKLKARAEVIGKAYPSMLLALIARPYERIYRKALDIVPASLGEADNIAVVLDCVCIDSSNEGVELMWDIALFMYDETAIMWHAMLGSLLLVKDRIVGDDSAGYGYEGRPWSGKTSE